MSLAKYHAKRNFKQTPEPTGKPHKGAKQLEFVVQEHHASQLHYDFRLELDGVLKSWAVPKGPSMDPHVHHLAVAVEDHPFAYRKFEGEIPKGNYGAGKVIIWDKGTYEPRTPSGDQQKMLRAGLKKGHLTFILHGKKLQGEFALIKLPHAQDNAWLLIKKGDEFASSSDVTKQDQSVISGRRVDDNPTELNVTKYPKKAAPWQVNPMLCTLVDAPFTRDGWLFELKWDGYRAIGSKHGKKIELYSRNHNDFRDKFAPVVDALAKIQHDVIFDGEIVVVDDHGKPHFEWLQDWHKTPQGTLAYFVFDVLWVSGHDVRTMPLLQRKALLQQLIPPHSAIHYSDHVLKNGDALFKEVQRQGLEGIVAKQADSPYQEAVRGPAWLKIKTHLRQEVVIGGYTEPRRGRKYFGALVVGVYKNGALEYVGHSGGGIPDDFRRDLLKKMQRLERKNSPFKVEPKPNAPVHWVRPNLVCEMNFSEWTKEGYMRQPKFVGMRQDKPATTVRRELPKTAAPKSAGTPFTHLDKVFWPEAGYTKGDLINYYDAISKIMLPYLKNRPHSLNRHPNGIAGPSFFQKDVTGDVPKFVTLKSIYSNSHGGNVHYVVCNNKDTLLYMAQLGCIEINPWNSRVNHLKKPDWLVIDLDPEGVDFKTVVKVAQTVHQVCDEWHLPAYPKTSGKTGIHIFMPMGATYSYDQVKNFAHLIALEVNKRLPDITSVQRSPAKRPHRVYLDFLQNNEGQTLAAPYSVRPTPQATVATPLHWDEVTARLDPTRFTIKTTLKRVQKEGDLWKGVLGRGVNLAKILKQVTPTDT